MGVINVPAGGDLQLALNISVGGDIIRLEQGQYTGPYTLTVGKTSPVTVEGFGTLVSNSNTTLGTERAPNCRNWILRNFIVPSSRDSATPVSLGYIQQLANEVPSHIWVDGITIDGGIIGAHHGLGLHSAYTTIENSRITNIFRTGIETQALWGCNGPGPYLIRGNYLSGGSIGLMFGGTPPSIPGLVPSNIIIEFNTFDVPIEWRYKNFSRKNHLELKNADTVLIRENDFEENWLQGQNSYSIVFTPRAGGTNAPWTRVRRVKFTKNRVKLTGNGINLMGKDTNNPSDILSDIEIYDNDFHISRRKFGGNGRFVQLVRMQDGRNVKINGNRVINDGDGLFADSSIPGPEGRIPATGLVEYCNNIITRGAIRGNGVADGTDAVNTYYPHTRFEGNITSGFIYPEESLERWE